MVQWHSDFICHWFRKDTWPTSDQSEMRNLLDSSKKGFLTIKDTFLVFSWAILYLAVIPRAAPHTFPIIEINMWKKWIPWRRQNWNWKEPRSSGMSLSHSFTHPWGCYQPAKGSGPQLPQLYNEEDDFSTHPSGTFLLNHNSMLFAIH